MRFFTPPPRRRDEYTFDGMIDNLNFYDGQKEESPEVEVTEVSARPEKLWIDRTGAGSGIIFRAVTTDEAIVEFVAKRPNGNSTPLGAVETTIVGGEHVALKAWWGNGLPVEDGEWEIVASVAGSSKSAGFKVKKTGSEILGFHGRWARDKDPIALLPDEPVTNQCLAWAWDQLATRNSGFFSGLVLGDPVNAFTGNFLHAVTDLTLKAKHPLVLARVYNSLDPKEGPFGRGWSSPYFSRLAFEGTRVILTNADGGRVVFESQNGTYTGPEGCPLKLLANGGNWIVVHPGRTRWVFDSQGRILSMENCCKGTSGFVIEFTYGPDNTLSRVSNPAGQWMNFTYDGNGRITQVADVAGRTVSYAYSENGDLVRVEDPLGRETGYQYDDSGFLNRIVEPGNRVTTLTYEDRRVIGLTNPNGLTTTFTRDDQTNTLEVTEPTGTVRRYRFDEEGILTGYEVPGANVLESFQYQGTGVTGYVNSLGGHRGFSYNGQGLLGRIIDETGQETEFEYHPIFQRLAKKTDGLGRTWEYGYATDSALLTERNPGNGFTQYSYDSFGNRTTKTDPLGRVTRSIFSADGANLFSVIDPLGGVSSFTYDLRGNLLTSTDQLGRVTTFQHDLLNRLVKTIYPDGRFVEVEYDQAGNVALRRDQLGRETRFTYDAAGRLLASTRPDGATVTAGYDAGGRKTSETDPLGRITRFEFDGLGRLTKTIYPDGTFETMEYDSEGRLTARVDALGNRTAFEYDPMGRLLATIDSTGARWESQYDVVGRKVADKDPLNRTTSYQFDTLDRITKVIRPDGSFVTNAFDAVGNLLGTTDALGNQWRWVYDALNRQVQAIRPDGGVSTTLFDAAGQVLAETDALNRTTRYVFDLGGRRTATTDALGNVWQNLYDNAGRLIATKDPLGAVSSLTYDIMDRVLSQSDALGNVTSFEFDAAGRRIAKTDALGRRSIMAYDTRDRVTSEVDPEGRTVSFGYDLSGRRVRLTDGANRTWRWEFDCLGRVTGEIDPLGNRVLSGYDAIGNRTIRTNARGELTAFAFDLMNRLVREQRPDGTVATMAYDLEGREISRSDATGKVTKTWDAVGNLVSETFGPWGKTWTFGYDLVGNRIQAVSPEGETTACRFDALNRVVELDPPGQDDVIRYSFDAAGHPIGNTRPGVVTTQSFDAAGRLLAIRHERLQGAEKTVALRSYEYNPVGNRTAMTDENGERTGYAFDGSDWLTAVMYPDGKRVAYTYNGAGDRLTETVENPTITGHGRNAQPATETVVITYAFDPAGRMTARASDTYAFDFDGNLIQGIEGGEETRYLWSPDNRLVGVERDLVCDKHGKKRCTQCAPKTVGETYSYLPLDWRRVSRKADGQEFVSVYDGSDEAQEYQVLPGKTPGKYELKLLREYIGGPGTDDLEYTRYHGRTLALLKDALGSTIALTNRGGHAVAKVGYDSWGNLAWPDKPGHGVAPMKKPDLDGYLERMEGSRAFENGSVDPNHLGRHFVGTISPYLYTGRRYESLTGQYCNRNRYYNPKYGRFLTKDPIGFRGGNNLWAYPINPVLFTDPFGLSWSGTGSNWTWFESVSGLSGAPGKEFLASWFVLFHMNIGDDIQIHLPIPYKHEANFLSDSFIQNGFTYGANLLSRMYLQSLCDMSEKRIRIIPEPSTSPICPLHTLEIEMDYGSIGGVPAKQQTLGKLYHTDFWTVPQSVIGHELGHRLGLVDEFGDKNLLMYRDTTRIGDDLNATGIFFNIKEKVEEVENARYRLLFRK